MGGTIGDILPSAVGVALSPVPLIAVILILFTPRARSNSLAFVAGWMTGLIVAGGAALAIARGAGVTAGNGGGSTLSGILKLVLGLLLLMLAVRSVRKRPRGDEEPAMPGWMAAIDRFTAAKSLGLAAALSGVNPKNLALTIAAATTIASSGLPDGSQVVALAVFTVLASLSVAVPVVAYAALGDRADATLTGWKDWLVRNNSGVMAVVLLILSAKLVGDAIRILTGM